MQIRIKRVMQVKGMGTVQRTLSGRKHNSMSVLTYPAS